MGDDALACAIENDVAAPYVAHTDRLDHYGLAVPDGGRHAMTVGTKAYPVATL
jgi:hypothetical protein